MGMVNAAAQTYIRKAPLGSSVGYMETPTGFELQSTTITARYNSTDSELCCARFPENNQEADTLLQPTIDRSFSIYIMVPRFAHFSETTAIRLVLQEA